MLFSVLISVYSLLFFNVNTNDVVMQISIPNFQNRKSLWTENKQEKYFVCRVWKQSKDGREWVWAKPRRQNLCTSKFPQLYCVKPWHVVKIAQAVNLWPYGLSRSWCRWLSTLSPYTWCPEDGGSVLVRNMCPHPRLQTTLKMAGVYSFETRDHISDYTVS